MIGQNSLPYSLLWNGPSKIETNYKLPNYPTVSRKMFIGLAFFLFLFFLRLGSVPKDVPSSKEMGYVMSRVLVCFGMFFFFFFPSFHSYRIIDRDSTTVGKKKNSLIPATTAAGFGRPLNRKHYAFSLFVCHNPSHKLHLRSVP